MTLSPSPSWGGTADAKHRQGGVRMGENSDTDKARAMRKALTPPEARMWLFLKALRSTGCHFRRQVPFRGYFLDFACHTNRLVIEVDGSSHQDRGDHDARRDAVLAREGYRTLRFTNHAIRDEFHFVQDAITAALKTSPSPSWGGTAKRSEARVGPCEAEGDGVGGYEPHPDRFAVFPPHKGEGEK